ncbi:ammonium transporter [Alteromonas aestuariivivens]|uniref:Ammonium transporter n=1 Tax=Alteromonas aestuariivivens TaxID=1938339 RepID=A0A3D8MEF8_9ALTE|nr:ammonium transporter [Alteromonas aestuariivivens]RDV28990.1 ammonium transporter [Alteromonas aestuariivivens]
MEFGWLLICSVLVFLMQAGFLCLETGKIRSKNSINVAAKNLADFIVCTVLFWLFGFGVMFGDSLWGIIGTSEHLFGANQSPWQIAFFFFQLMFCGTAATLMSGAVAERMSFAGYLVVTVLLCSVIYPVIGHWSWSGIYQADNPGWLEAKGFVDFAGATVVHSVGGWVALAATIVIGPRLGRFNKQRQFPVGNNLPLSTLGTLMIFAGWFGFNGGSTLTLNDQVPGILLNTCLAAVWGGLAASALSYAHKRFIDVSFILNGVIAGLVAITAAAHCVSPAAASLIGAVGGVVMYAGSLQLERWRIDDVLNVVPAHLFAGIWGTLAVALFGAPEKLTTGLAFGQQLAVQLFGVITIGLYCFGVSFAAILLLNRYLPLRVSARNEHLGMNVSEHRATTELLDLLSSMQSQAKRGNFSLSVPVEPFTEVGQIARQYNQVIQRVRDEMSERDFAIDNFRSSEKRKSAILESAMDSIITIDFEGKIIEFNPAAERTFGLRKTQVLGKRFLDLFILDEDRQLVAHSLEHKFSASRGLLLNRRNTIILQRNSGDEFPAEIAITGASLGLQSESEYTLHIRDVTRQRKLQNKLKQLAYSDPLTGLYNRTYLLENLQKRLDRSSADGQRVAVFFLDLDRFKKINDTLGHKAGDELLLEVAARLMRVTRATDTIARWGGDEFVISMAGNLTEEAVLTTASKILDAMRAPVLLNGRELKIPTSIGVALNTDNTLRAENLIQQADIAMYFAKEDGRDNVKIFQPEMANQASRQFHYEQALRIAIQEQSPFVVVYQPKVDAKGTIVSLEALVRWHHSDGTVISPGQFIQVAEEANLIIELEKLVISRVIHQVALWRNKGLQPIPVAINLSGRHLLSRELYGFVSELLDQLQVPGEWLEFEVTEGVFVTDIVKCIEILTTLKQRNISIAIDDFGTGYSSLNYLKTLPVDVLKIDRTFVEDCAISREDGKICDTIISLAASLNLKTIAEGVETLQQFEFLRNLGCNEFQGFYFYRPMPLEDIEALLEQLPAKQLSNQLLA